MLDIDRMKRPSAAFITVHVGENFGSALQAIATYKVLEKIGTDPILINYIPPRVTFLGYLKNGLNSPRDFVKMILKLPCFIKNKKIFESFVKKNCKITPPIYAGDDFARKLPSADCYITGSDQVWNFVYNEGFDSHYYLCGVKGKKISYASSMGMTQLSEYEKELVYRNLSRYEKLSVREESGREVLKNLGFEDVKVLLDPTFMLNKEEWSKYSTSRQIEKPYLFVYMPYNASDEDAHYKIIRRIATERNLLVVSFSLTYLADKRADLTVHYPSPGDFLSLVLNADYVVTNSFHGTAFSINLNKDFTAICPQKFSTRVTNILTMLGLTDRLVSGFDVSEIHENNICPLDYFSINRQLNLKREEAITYLKNAL